MPFTLLAVAHGGKLAMNAVLLLASVRARDPQATYKVVLAEPEPGPLWPGDRTLDADTRKLLIDLGAEVRPFPVRHFGRDYPYGNKIEALTALGPEPFVFVDTDTLILNPLGEVPFDFSRPMGSLRRSDTWPKQVPGGPTRAQVWQSLYDMVGLPIAGSLNPDFPEDDWRHHLYVNAGFWFHENARAFGKAFLQTALQIRDNPPAQLHGQSLDPWLDQVALPLIITRFDGGHRTLPDGMIDGSHTCHYRNLALLYAREPDSTVDCLEQIAAPNPIKRTLKKFPAAHRLIYRGEGRKLRKSLHHMADGDERPLRKALKSMGYWDL